MIRVLLAFLLIASTGCQKKTDETTTTPISIRGAREFGRVILGDQIESVIVLDNSAGDRSESLLQSLNPPFYLVSYQPSSCTSLSVPAKTTCFYKVRFTPSVVGHYSTTVTFKGDSVTLNGQGIKPGEATISPTSFSIGTVAAGSNNDFEITLSNSGDSDLLFPDFSGSDDMTIATTSCDKVIRPKTQCLITARITPLLKNPTYSGALKLNGVNAVTFIGSVTAGASAGNISFNLAPAVVELPVFKPNNPAIIVTVTTNVIADQFGNPVEDGTPVDVNVLNLRLLDDPTNQKRALLFTKNGAVSFQVQAGDAIGQANFSAQTETSYGSFLMSIRD